MPKYTVHNIPFLLRPLVFVYGWLGGLSFILINFVFRNLIKIEYVDGHHVNDAPNFIFSLWHENLPLFFIAHPKFSRQHCWLSFPFWYMKPVHIFKKLIGIKEIAYGASGIDGRLALKQVINRLNEGYCTFINPDGPKGPAHVVKEGALLMGLKTETPIIPLSFHVEGSWRLPSWDGKRYPPFFKTLKIVYGNPINVTANNFDWAREEIADKMNDPSVSAIGISAMPQI